MEEAERRRVRTQQEIEEQEMFSTAGAKPSDAPVEQTADGRYVTLGDVEDQANVVGEGADQTHYRNAPDLAQELEQLHTQAGQLEEPQRQAAEAAVTGLENELAEVKPDPLKVNTLLERLVNTGGTVGDIAQNIRNTTAIQTILFNLPDMQTTPQPATDQDVPESQRIVGKD